MISRSEFDETICEYNDKYHEMDKAIKARGKVMDHQRNKVTDYRERFCNIQHENDNLKYELDKETKYSESLTSELKDLKFKFKNVCDKLKAKDEAVAEIVDKFKNDKAAA